MLFGMWRSYAIAASCVVRSRRGPTRFPALQISDLLLAGNIVKDKAAMRLTIIVVMIFGRGQPEKRLHAVAIAWIPAGIPLMNRLRPT